MWPAFPEVESHKRHRREVQACRPWLMAEIDTMQPDLVVSLGATAAASLLGPSSRLTRRRGVPIEQDGFTLLATVHPSSILRNTDEQSRRRAMEEFVADLRCAAELLAA